MHIDEIFESIRAEREYQEARWGEEFDRKNTPNDWVTYITSYTTKAACVSDEFDYLKFRENILKAATLCVAVLERGEYGPRHYDGDRTPGLRSPDYAAVNGPCISSR